MFIVGINPPFPVMDGLWHCYTHAVESVRGLAQIFCYIPQRMPNSSGCVLMIPANFTVGLARIWLVVSIPLKNISQLGWLFQIYGIIKNVPNRQPEIHLNWWSRLRPPLWHRPRPQRRRPALGRDRRLGWLLVASMVDFRGKIDEKWSINQKFIGFLAGD